MEDHKLDMEIRNWLRANEREIPAEVALRIKETLGGLGSGPRKPRWAAAAAALVLGALLLGLIMGGYLPGVAESLKKLPVLSSIFELEGDRGLKMAAREGYSSGVNQSAVDQGITLTLNEVMYDGTRLCLGMTVKAEPEAMGAVNDVQCYVNSQELRGGQSQQVNQINERELVSVYEIIPDDELPEEFELEIHVNRVGESRGTWNFRIPVSKAKLSGASREFTPRAAASDGERQLAVNKVVLGPSATLISLDMTGPEVQDVFVTGIRVQYRVFDDQGVALGLLGLDAGGSRERQTINIRCMPLARIPDHLIVQPVMLIPHGPKFMMETELADTPPLLSYGEIVRIQLDGIEYLTEKTVLHCQIQLLPAEINPDTLMRCIYLRDARGQEIRSTGQPTREDEISMQYTIEFPPVKTGEASTIGVRYNDLQIKPMEGLRVKIPLK